MFRSRDRLQSGSGGHVDAANGCAGGVRSATPGESRVRLRADSGRMQHSRRTLEWELKRVTARFITRLARAAPLFGHRPGRGRWAPDQSPITPTDERWGVDDGRCAPPALCSCARSTVRHQICAAR